MLQIDSLEDIAALRESVDIECKLAQGRDGKGALPKDIWETYSAFANTQGGDIFLGLKEKANRSFEFHGIEDTQKVLDELWNTLNNPQKVSCNILREHWVKVIRLGDKNLIQIHVPRSPRKYQPVFINGNPLKGTYRRFNSGDVLQSDAIVRRLLAEQLEESRDARILKGFGLDDLDRESLQGYRNLLSAHKTNHPWIALNEQELLTRLGGWRKDRETGEEGLTLAGLLMFGQHRPIMEALPNYFLDYQELPDDTTEIRWLDRVVPDGTWSGNLLDFYRRVIRKLEADLKTPFAIHNNIRQDDTLLHQALREAFINCLVHADYSDRASIKVTKSPKGFTFRNPGMMRVPAEIALEGGESDCRNRALHEMFLLIGLGERAGSGLPKIQQGWTEQGHSLVLYDSLTPYDQTVAELTWGALEKTTQKTPEKSSEKSSEKHASLLAYIAAEPGISAKALADKLGITSRAVEKQLAQLKDQGKLQRMGPAKGGHWEIIERD